jgi:hypothetical protein
MSSNLNVPNEHQLGNQVIKYLEGEGASPAEAGKIAESVIKLYNAADSSLSTADQTGQIKVGNSVGSGPPLPTSLTAAADNLILLILNEGKGTDDSGSAPPAGASGSNGTKGAGATGGAAGTTKSGGATANKGNPFLSPGMLVAVLVDMMKLAGIEAKTALSQNQLQIKQMNLAESDTKSEAKTIIAKTNAQVSGLIAQGVTSMVSGVIAVAQALSTVKAGGEAEDEATTREEGLDQNVKAQETDLDTANNELTDAEDDLKTTTKDLDEKNAAVNSAQKNYNNVNGKDPAASPAEKNDAQDQLDNAKKDQTTAETKNAAAKKAVDKAQTKVDKAESKLEDAQDAQKNFNKNEYVMKRVQEITQVKNQVMDAFSKFVEAAGSFMQASFKAQEGTLEAQQTIYQTNIQLAMKGIDNAASNAKDMNEAISAIMQAVTQLQNDERKLGTIYTASQAS